MRAQHALLALAVGLALVGAALAARAEDSKLTAEDRAAFEWLSTIELPDVQGKPYVGVEVRYPRDRHQTFSSWLLSEDEQSVRLFGANLSETTIPKRAAGEDTSFVSSRETLDLGTFAREYLAGLRGGDDHFGEIMDRRLTGGLGLRAEIFVFAWGCWRQGLDDLAHEIRAEAVKLGDRSAGKEHERPFLPEVQRQIGDRLHWNAAEAFEDRRVSRRQLLAMYQRLAKHFPEDDEHAGIVETAAILERMVKEDEEHAARPKKPFESLSPDEKAAELVFQLRGADGVASRAVGKGPGKELEGLGLAAVPRLLEALDDTSFTRSLHYGFKAYNRPFPMHVWELASNVLQRLSGRPLWEDGMYATKDGPQKTAKRLALAWWAEVQAKGEQGVLVAATKRGDTWSGDQAKLLVARYPDVALAAIEEGLAHAKETWHRSALIDAAAELPADAPVAFLLHELEVEPALAVRLTAAQGLFRHGKTDGIPKMIEAWKAARRDGAREHEGLIAFLASCRSTDAIAALGEGLRERPLDVRLAVVEAFSGRGSFVSFSTGEGAPGGARGGGEVGPETRDAIEKLLVECLEDTEARTGMSGSWNGKSYHDPRVCDFAGFMLNERWPDRFEFDLGESQVVRDRQRLAILATWRAAHGKQPATEPGDK